MSWRWQLLQGGTTSCQGVCKIQVSFSFVQCLIQTSVVVTKVILTYLSRRKALFTGGGSRCRTGYVLLRFLWNTGVLQSFSFEICINIACVVTITAVTGSHLNLPFSIARGHSQLEGQLEGACADCTTATSLETWKTWSGLVHKWPLSTYISRWQETEGNSCTYFRRLSFTHSSLMALVSGWRLSLTWWSRTLKYDKA